MRDYMSTLSFQQALEKIWELISYTNRYIDHNAPWALAKDPEKKERLNTVLYSATEALRFLCLYLNPFMPLAMQRLWEQLGQESSVYNVNILEQAKWGGLKPHTKVEKGKQLFPRIQK
ncbi:MAG: hypothetical protein D6828_03630 [Nitrospirae bacterium]|nr:MAG: hypothetical protein D6828_03630 [Nitrospirota bacterium]